MTRVDQPRLAEKRGAFRRFTRDRAKFPHCATLFSRAALMGAILVGIALSPPARADDIGPGRGQQDAAIAGTVLRIYTYRPSGCVPRALFLVFHGVGRNADGYRNHAEKLADAVCALVVAPLFDKARFPQRAYQYGGIADAQGDAVPAGHRTVDLVAPLIAWGRASSGTPDQGASLKLVLIGHSAGAQFLGRVAAFAPPPDADGIILANPSTWVMPDVGTEIPYGFGGFSPPSAAESALKTYLALPVTVLLGQADVLSKELAREPEAMAQGPTRLARGEGAFAAARDAAAARGWSFGWTKAEVPGVGHSAAKMFDSPEAVAAITRAVGSR